MRWTTWRWRAVCALDDVARDTCQALGAGSRTPQFATRTKSWRNDEGSGRRGLTLVHSTAQPKPFWSLSQCVSSLLLAVTHHLFHTVLNAPNVSHKRCSH
jgi:hypothetical protein